MSASTCWRPRAALMIKAPPAAPSRLSLRKSGKLRMPRVSGVSGSRLTRISVRARNASSPSGPWKSRRPNGLRRAAPARDTEADARQHLGGLGADRPDPHDADRHLVGAGLIVRLPDALALLRIVDLLLAMAHQHVKTTSSLIRMLRSGCTVRTSGTRGKLGRPSGNRHRPRPKTSPSGSGSRTAICTASTSGTHRRCGRIADAARPKPDVALRCALAKGIEPGLGARLADRDRKSVGRHGARIIGFQALEKHTRRKAALRG